MKHGVRYVGYEGIWCLCGELFAKRDAFNTHLRLTRMPPKTNDLRRFSVPWRQGTQRLYALGSGHTTACPGGQGTHRAHKRRMDVTHDHTKR